MDTIIDRIKSWVQPVSRVMEKPSVMSTRKVLPHEKVIGSSVGDCVRMCVQHPDGSLEYVRDLEKEKEWDAENARINNRRHELITALKTRVVSEAEMTEVLRQGTELLAHAQTGFGRMYRQRDREDEFLFLLKTQAAIRELVKPA